MTVMAGMMLMLSSTFGPVAEFDLATHDDAPATIRLTRALKPPRRSRYRAPMLDAVDADAAPAKLRWRGRRIKLRVPVGPGG